MLQHRQQCQQCEDRDCEDYGGQRSSCLGHFGWSPQAEQSNLEGSVCQVSGLRGWSDTAGVVGARGGANHQLSNQQP